MFAQKCFSRTVSYMRSSRGCSTTGGWCSAWEMGSLSDTSTSFCRQPSISHGRTKSPMWSTKKSDRLIPTCALNSQQCPSLACSTVSSSIVGILPSVVWRSVGCSAVTLFAHFSERSSSRLSSSYFTQSRIPSKRARKVSRCESPVYFRRCIRVSRCLSSSSARRQCVVSTMRLDFGV